MVHKEGSLDLSKLIGAASAAHAAGQFDQALALCGQILEADPSNVQALLLVGVIESKVRDPQKAVQVLESVRQMDPNSFHAPFWQSHAYKRMGMTHEALESAIRSHELNPEDPQGLAQLAMCQMDARLLVKAEANLRAASAKAPQVIPLRYNLSQCLALEGKRLEAESVLKQALSSSRQNAESLLKLAQFLLSQNNPLGAAVCAKEALRMDPNSSLAKLVLGRILLEDHRTSEAETYLESALAKDSSDSQSQALLGTAFQGLGRLDDAIHSFEKSIQLTPQQGFAYFGLIHSRKVVEQDRPMINRLHAISKGLDLAPKQMSFLQYGLGKAHEDLGDYQESMEAFDEANRIEFELKFKDRAFDPNRYAATFDQTIRQFTGQMLSDNKSGASESDVPIFVIGMMRSGTTLVEQIIASHPDTGGVGEQSFWLDNWREGVDDRSGMINRSGLNRAAERYLGILNELAPDKGRIVDKMPVNYAGLGILHLAFPNAKFIHTRRNPVDTCISIYATPNRSFNEYAHDKANIVFAYRQYLRIMEHWKQVLPEGCLLDVDYESLVTNSEAETRRMIDFCGLDWNDACLKPQESKKSVVTPSVWQVRQPLYTTSIERWQRFKPWLGAFNELLP